MNPSDTEQHRIHRSRFETNLMRWIEEDKIWRNAFKCIFSELSMRTDKSMFGKTINCKHGFYIIRTNPDWIKQIIHKLKELNSEFTILLDHTVENISYYQLKIEFQPVNDFVS